MGAWDTRFEAVLDMVGAKDAEREQLRPLVRYLVKTLCRALVAIRAKY